MFIRKLKESMFSVFKSKSGKGAGIKPEFSEFQGICETILNYPVKAEVLLDIGAYKGMFCKTVNNYFGFEKSFCFEPNSKLHPEIKRNNPETEIYIEELALSSKKGEEDYYHHEDSSMNSLVEAKKNMLKEEFPWDNPDLIEKVTIDVERLDDFITKKKLNRKTFFIKIDTQGNELEILKNGINTLQNTTGILVEFMFTNPYKTTYSFSDLVSFMNEQDFECKGALTIRKRPSKKVSAVDFLFIRKGLDHNIIK